MDTPRHNPLSVLATGVVVLVLLSLSLFWLRLFVSAQRRGLLPRDARSVGIPLSPRRWGLTETPDPNQPFPGAADAWTSAGAPFLAGLGAPHYVRAQIFGGPNSYVYRWVPEPDGEQLYYDAVLGQIVYKRTEETRHDDGTRTVRRVTYFAGPDGVGSQPDRKLGRFRSLIADAFCLSPQIVYDRALRRFFAIDWRQQTVQQGPQLPDEDGRRPLQIRVLAKNSDVFRAEIAPNRPKDGPPGIPIHWESYLLPQDRLLVLDASGRIDLLDGQKLKYAGVAGILPAPPLFSGITHEARPDDVVAYDVKPFLVPRRGTDNDRRYGGCAVASLSREGLAVQLTIFDPNGRGIGGGDTQIRQYLPDARGNLRESLVPSARAAYFTLPGAEVLTGAEFVLESLHPPGLLLLSYLAAPHMEASAGYRSLFLLPDSFVAKVARDSAGTLIDRILVTMLLACPAVLLALSLAWRIDRDAAKTGLSKSTRRAWWIVTIGLGLPAYITYRLTRPRVTMVTCANCGVGRRPDRDKCQHCGSPWTVPELTPPAWRVRGAAEQGEENAFSREPQADSQVQ